MFNSEESCSTLESTKIVAHVMYSGAVDGMAVVILNNRGHLTGRSLAMCDLITALGSYKGLSVSS